MRETRRRAWDETTFDVVLRSYYLSRDNFDDTRSEAWALGGWAGFKTGYFRERFAFGATAYTSQSASADEDEDGTLLLAPGQQGYSVLGELYGELLVNENIRVAGGRLGVDTPYINRIDNRMTPNTFEALMMRGLYGGGEGEAELRFGGGYVGAINYYSDDIINIFYSEAKYAMPVRNDMRLQFAAQFGDQRSTGDDLLRGRGFSSHHWGIKGELAIGGALFTTTYTTVRGDTGIHRPWGAYPGYALVQVDDFSRDGEDAWMLRAGYAFQTVKGLGLHAVWVNGSDPDLPTEYAHDEYNLDVQWAPPEGALKGLQLRLRYSLIEQDDPMQSEQSDFRVMRAGGGGAGRSGVCCDVLVSRVRDWLGVQVHAHTLVLGQHHARPDGHLTRPAPARSRGSAGRITAGSRSSCCAPRGSCRARRPAQAGQDTWWPWRARCRARAAGTRRGCKGD